MSMRGLSRWLLACVFCLGMAGSPAAWAVFCTQVFPANATQGGVDLTAPIDAIFDGVSPADYSIFDSNGTHYDTVDRWFYNSGSLGTWGLVTVKAGATTWLFFDGDLDLQPNSTINPLDAALDSGGNPEDLIIIVRGNLEISTHNAINALIYATGNVTVQPNSNVLGAITAKGTVTVQNPGNTTVTYDAEAAATFDMPGLCTPASVHHYQLEYGGPGLTCQAHTVNVTACGDAACSVRLAVPGSVVARDLATGNDLASASFTTATTGPTAVLLSVGIATEVSLRVAGTATTLCNVADCRLAFSGTALQLKVPDLIAGQPDVLTVTHCQSDFANTKNKPVPLQFWSTYLDPGTGSTQVLINGGAVGRSQSEATTLYLDFVDGSTTVPVQYFDAGLMRLQALGSWSKGNTVTVMAGDSPPFVSRPYGLRLDAGGLAANGCFDAGGVLAMNAPGCAKWVAGDDFSLSIQAVAVDGSTITPNFRLNNIELSSTLVEPADGGNGSLSQPDYDHQLGNTTTVSLSQSEVGIFRIHATPRANAYFGYTVGGGETLVGRFTPARLGVTSTARLTPACGAFSYQGQSMNFAGGQPGIVVTGYNRQGEVTRNYDRDPFWRQAPPQRQPYAFSDTSKPGLVARLQSLGDPQSLAVADSGGADGSRAFDWRAAGVRQADALLWQLPSPPTAEDLPFVLTAAGEHVQLKVAAGELTDLDGICYLGSSATCQDFSHAFGGTEVRLGRLRIDAASGPGNQSLDLPYWLESWQASASGPVFGATTGDTCSLAALGDVVLSDFTGALQASHFPQPPAPPGTLETATGTPLPTGVIRLPAPNQSGSVLASLSGLNGASPALPWLLFDWDGNGTPEAPAARATFGVYSGPRALIFRREIYR